MKKIELETQLTHCDFILWKFQMLARRLVELLPQRKGTKRLFNPREDSQRKEGRKRPSTTAFEDCHERKRSKLEDRKDPMTDTCRLSRTLVCIYQRSTTGKKGPRLVEMARLDGPTKPIIQSNSVELLMS